MRIGSLDRRVTLLRAVTADDGFTTAPGAPLPIGQRSASKVDVSDRERAAAAQQGTEITTRFQLHFDCLTRTLTSADQLQCEGITYQITAAKEIGRREGVEVTAARRNDSSS